MQVRDESMQLENKIGLFWLNRLGIGALVLGFAFLMMYSMQQMGPMVKIALGLIVSVALMIGGELMGRHEHRRWFGHGLAAGGWSLAYFVTYAAYYIPEAQVIYSLPVETFLLMGVAVGSLGWSVRARSEPLAILSMALAGVSILFSEPSLVADSSFLILAVLASFLGYRHGWKMLFAFAVGVCYFGHYYCSQGLLHSAHAATDPLLSAIFIACIWLSFSIGLGYCTKLDQAKNSFVISVSYANAALFAGGLCTFGTSLDKNVVETILAASGAVYLGMARWLHKRDCMSLSNVHLLLGLSLLNGAKAMRFTGLEMLSLDIMQIWLLMVLGIKNNISAFKYFAYFLLAVFGASWFYESSRFVGDAVCGFTCFPCDKLALVAVIAFAHVAFFSRKNYIPSGQNEPCFDFGKGNMVVNGHEKAFYIFANCMYLFLIQHLVSHSALCLALAVQCAISMHLGLKLKDQIYSTVGVVTFVACAAASFQYYDSWSGLFTGLEVAVFYALYFVSRKEQALECFEADCVKLLAPNVATVLLTVLLMKEISGTYLTFTLGLEGLILMIVAFLGKDKLLRSHAFAVIFVLVGKLLLFDLANRGTLERIVSFIGAGVTLLLSSYVYALGTDAFKPKQRDEDEPFEHFEEAELPDLTPTTRSELRFFT